jgi:hypothetical protein
VADCGALAEEFRETGRLALTEGPPTIAMDTFIRRIAFSARVPDEPYAT